MGLLNPHLDEAAFAQLWTDRYESGPADVALPAERHLAACAECRSRYAAFTGWLESVRVDATAEAEEAMTTERLAAQQAQILRRLEGFEHPARVIAFPRFAQPVSTQPHAGRRWVAAAAAAGLVAGLGLGQWVEFPGVTPAARPESVQRTIARGPVAAEPRRVAVSQVSDETDLYGPDPSQVRVPESLQYLNAITPYARDYDR